MRNVLIRLGLGTDNPRMDMDAKMHHHSVSGRKTTPTAASLNTPRRPMNEPSLKKDVSIIKHSYSRVLELEACL